MVKNDEHYHQINLRVTTEQFIKLREAYKQYILDLTTETPPASLAAYLKGVLLITCTSRILNAAKRAAKKLKKLEEINGKY